MEKPKIKLFSLRGVFVILRSLSGVGINLFAILKIASLLYPNKKALCFEEEFYSYKELYEKANSLRALLYKDYGLKKGFRAGFFCSNSLVFVLSIFALSGLGLDIYLMNYEQNREYITALLDRFKFDFIIYDANIESCLTERRNTKGVDTVRLFELLRQKSDPTFRVKNSYFNRIVVLTSGTTGIASIASRKTSAMNYLVPLKVLSVKLKVWRYQTFYITTPIYHGFGLVSLLISLVLGKEIYLCHHFDAASVNVSIKKYKIEAIVLVPIMLQRMIKLNVLDLQSLKCIISGGAKIPSSLVNYIQKMIGDTLYNLYGTSEAGVSMMATPSDLFYSASTIGKPLPGVKTKVVDEDNIIVNQGFIGELFIKCKWSIHPKEWVRTGDLVYVDKQGYYYLVDRVDDMIVSGGENVYPSELEDIIKKHPLVDDVVVKGIHDGDYGQRLKAFIVLSSENDLSKHDLFVWIRQRVYKFQVPKEIVIVDSLPTNAIMKVDRKKLM